MAENSGDVPTDTRDAIIDFGGGVRGTDSAGHTYEEFAMSADEHIRVTFIPHQDWANGPTLRVQKRDYRGRMVQGPEFPARLAGELAKALHDVLQTGERRTQ